MDIGHNVITDLLRVAAMLSACVAFVIVFFSAVGIAYAKGVRKFRAKEKGELYDFTTTSEFLLLMFCYIGLIFSGLLLALSTKLASVAFAPYGPIFTCTVLIIHVVSVFAGMHFLRIHPQHQQPDKKEKEPSPAPAIG